MDENQNKETVDENTSNIETNLPTEAENQPKTDTPSAKATKSTKFVKVLILLLLVVIIVGIGYYYLASSDENQTNQENSEVVVEDEQLPAVSTYLLQTNQTSNGVSVGYITAEKSVSKGSFFSPKVSAQEIEYQPVVFYSYNSNIYSLNTITKETEQVSTETGSTPVYSSAKQKLAYNKTSCNVVIKDIQTQEEVTIVEGSESSAGEVLEISPENICYSPVAWSPNGDKIAISGSYSINSPELGLVGFSDVYIYDTAEKTIEKLDAPEGYNSMYTNDSFRWIDNDNALVDYVDRGAYGAENSRQLNQIDTNSKEINVVTTNIPLSSVAETTFIEESIVALGLSPREVIYTESGDLNGFEAIKDSFAGSYLVEYDDSLNSVYTLDGLAGSENSFSLSKFDVNGAKEELFRPQGFSAYMLGWGLNYDEIIYMAILSGKSEIHQYTISTGTNEVLVPDLPLQ